MYRAIPVLVRVFDRWVADIVTPVAARIVKTRIDLIQAGMILRPRSLCARLLEIQFSHAGTWFLLT